MDTDKMSAQNWSEPVLEDLAQAFRRDGLVKSAEMLDDVRIVLAQEVQALEKARKSQRSGGQGALTLVVNGAHK